MRSPRKSWAGRFAGSPALFRETSREAGSGLGGDWPRVRLGGDRAGRERWGGDDWLRGGAGGERAGRRGSGRVDWLRGGWGGTGGFRACQCEGAAGSAAGRGRCGRCGAAPRSGHAGGAPRCAAPLRSAPGRGPPFPGSAGRAGRGGRGAGPAGPGGGRSGAGSGGTPPPEPDAVPPQICASGAPCACGSPRAASACGRAAPFGGAVRRPVARPPRSPSPAPLRSRPAPCRSAPFRPCRCLGLALPPDSSAVTHPLFAASCEVQFGRSGAGLRGWALGSPLPGIAVSPLTLRARRTCGQPGRHPRRWMRGVPAAARGGAGGEVRPVRFGAAPRSGCDRVPVCALLPKAVAMNPQC